MSDGAGLPDMTTRQRLDAAVEALRAVLDNPPGDEMLGNRAFAEFVLVREETYRRREGSE